MDTFEVQNEPDLMCMWQDGLTFEQGVARYKAILEAGAEAIRRGAPGKRVAGIDVSGGDYDGGLKYSDRMMAECGARIDVYTGHPYAGVRYFGPGQEPMWPVRNEERRKCLDTLAMIRRHGGSQRFWVGEKGWGLGITLDPLSTWSADFAACMVQSMTLAHAVPGVERYFWFLEEGCNEGGYEYGLFREGKPLPAALAYATLAHTLHHAKPVASPELGGSLQAHVFEAPETGCCVAVLWSDDSAVLRMFPGPTAWTAKDMMGDVVAAGRPGSAVRLTLSRAPVYLLAPTGQGQRLAAALRSAKVGVRNPVRIEAAYLSTERTAIIRLRNASPTAQTPRWRIGTRAGGLRIAPGAAADVRVSLPEAPTQSVPVGVVAEGQTVADIIPVRLHQIAPAAGRLDSAGLFSVTGPPDFVLDKRSNVLPADPGVGWTGPDSLSARIWTAWDAANLYLSVEVRDPVHFAPHDSPGAFWDGDSIQIGIDPNNDAGSAPGYMPDDREFGLVLGPSGMKVNMTVPETRAIAAIADGSRKGDRTLYRAAIPWNELGVRVQSGKVLGLNMVVNQNNGKGRAYWMGITPGIGEGKRPGVFRDVSLAHRR